MKNMLSCLNVDYLLQSDHLFVQTGSIEAATDVPIAQKVSRKILAISFFRIVLFCSILISFVLFSLSEINFNVKLSINKAIGPKTLQHVATTPKDTF